MYSAYLSQQDNENVSIQIIYKKKVYRENHCSLYGYSLICV